MIPHSHDLNPLLQIDHSTKYKVIEVYDKEGNYVERIACMGPELPISKLNKLRLGAKWHNAKNKQWYERVA